MIGVLGAGQLGRMLALAGYPLGLRFRFLDTAHEAPIKDLAEFVRADFRDADALARFAAGLEVATYEFENVPVEAAEKLSQRISVFPPPAALRASQDRLDEKTFFHQLDIPTAPFVAVRVRVDLDRALAEVGCPAILKTRRMGYDGKGQFLLRERADAEQAWQTLTQARSASEGTSLAGASGLCLEGFVLFERELSQLAVRGRDGAMVFYPLVENHHAEGMLRLSLAPAPNLTPALEQLAREYATHVLQALNYVGVLAIEFFQQGEQLIANEMAPRVHNSGHWTIEGAETSQFENHLRALLGLPLGVTDAREPCAMLNIIGELPDTRTVLAHPGTHLHLYGKKPRPGRKIGHLTVRASTREEVQARIEQLRTLLRQEECRSQAVAFAPLQAAARCWCGSNHPQTAHSAFIEWACLSRCAHAVIVANMKADPSEAGHRAASRLASFRYAFAGWWYVLRTQRNAWIHAVASVAVFLVALWLRLPRIDWAILILTVAVIWVAEFVNTSVEAVVDLLSPDIHPLAKAAKDIAAAAVLIAALAAVVVGLLVLGPPLWLRFQDSGVSSEVMTASLPAGCH